MKDRKVSIIIDCHNLGHMVSYGFGELTYKDRHTGVMYGFLKKVLELGEKFETNRFLFCWDSRHSYRKLESSEYKRGREEMSLEDLGDMEIMRTQFKQLRKEVLPRLGFKNIFHQNGYEADDLIAEIVARYPDKYIIFSSDSDLWQLLYEGRKGLTFVRIFDPRKKKLFTYKEFVKGWVITPSQWAMTKAIAGCPGDGVVGIEGIGLLSASRYLRGALSGKKLVLIESGKGQKIIRRNFNLVALPYVARRKIGIDVVHEGERFGRGRFKSVFAELGFKSFLTKFERWEKVFGLRKQRRLIQ